MVLSSENFFEGHPCLDGFEVQPPLAVYPNKILRCELAEVRITQAGITAEQEC